MKHLAAETQTRVAKSFISVVIAAGGGAVTTDIKEKNALDVKKAFSSVNHDFHPKA